MSKEENSLLKQCHKLVQLAGGMPNRRNNTAVYNPEGRWHSFSKFAIKGLGDMDVWWSGGDYWMVEFKKPGGKQSSDQKEVQKRMEELGHRYFVIEHVNQFIEVLRKEKKMDIE